MLLTEVITFGVLLDHNTFECTGFGCLTGWCSLDSLDETYSLLKWAYIYFNHTKKVKEESLILAALKK